MVWALLSVSDKTGIVDFARTLIASGYRLLASGGTGTLLHKEGVDFVGVSDLTGFPEIMAGRVKTLHPKIHAGILARRDQDAELLVDIDIPDIRLVVVNLYPFSQTLANSPDDHQKIIENIDIGGPALIRAAAKNHRWVTVITEPQDYKDIADRLINNELDQDSRHKLATSAFKHCSDYDQAIYKWLSEPKQETNYSQLDQQLSITAYKARQLRYGENPHQQAAMYLFNNNIADSDQSTYGWSNMRQYHGKPLSYNNIVDSEVALRCANDIAQNACVIVKHANPCGVACHEDLVEAYSKAFKSDSESAFGGIVAFNRPIDGRVVKIIADRQFVEVIIAPEVADDARELLEDKPNIRLISLKINNSNECQLRSISGGLLSQYEDSSEQPEHRQVAGPTPTTEQLLDLQQAWNIIKHIKSNAILIYHKGQSIGIGAGQTSRIQSLRIAIEQAVAKGFELEGAVLASDAFLPFADSVELAAQHGISHIIQSGGSIRDDQVIAAANAHGVGMRFTSRRYFCH